MSPAVIATVSAPPACAGSSGVAHSISATAPTQNVEANGRKGGAARDNFDFLAAGIATRGPRHAEAAGVLAHRKIHTRAPRLRLAGRLHGSGRGIRSMPIS